MNWNDVYNRIISKGWRKQVRDFVAKQPNMPAPDSMHGEYAHILEWGAGLRLSRDYLDFEVYEIHNLHWRQVTEQEFLDWMRIQYSL